MCNELQRLSELQSYSIGLQSPKAYFRHDDTKFSDPRKRRYFLDIERELQGLDIEAWRFLKSEALPRLKAQHPTRGWQQLFETLNEAKGFNFLARIGCTNIRFIPRSTTNGVQTPDLQSDLARTKALCEVKTINVSAIEAKRRSNGDVGTTVAHLDQGFFNKLACDVKTATSQMLAFSADKEMHRTAFIVVNFDDNLHEYADDYRCQIEQFVTNVLKPDVQVMFDIKPPFYSAM